MSLFGSAHHGFGRVVATQREVAHKQTQKIRDAIVEITKLLQRKAVKSLLHKSATSVKF